MATHPRLAEQQMQAELAKTEGREMAKVFAISLALDMISMDVAGEIAA